MRERESLTYDVIGAAMEVHKTLGCGFTERVYQDALEEELKIRGIPYEREARMHVTYKGRILESEYIPDFVCYGEVVVELKAVEELSDLNKAQAINYLHVSEKPVVLLINFGAESLEFHRFNKR
ncbi:MAG: GxxExxY protein [Bacteroidaceae bacterium]|nr:GxxExxY protein [Bacteroidaceae bacterium]